MEIIETNGITVTNEINVRGIALRDLIHTYIPGFSGCYYGFRSMGDNDLDYPCICIEPAMEDPKMVTLGKYQIYWTYNLFIFVRDNDPAGITTLIGSAVEALVKLFSNNALDDLSTDFTNKFKSYPPYWIDSEMNSIEISRMYINSTPDNPNQNRYLRAALMRFTIQDVVIK